MHFFFLRPWHMHSKTALFGISTPAWTAPGVYCTVRNIRSSSRHFRTRLGNRSIFARSGLRAAIATAIAFPTWKAGSTARNRAQVSALPPAFRLCGGRQGHASAPVARRIAGEPFPSERAGAFVNGSLVRDSRTRGDFERDSMGDDQGPRVGERQVHGSPRRRGLGGP